MRFTFTVKTEAVRDALAAVRTLRSTGRVVGANGIAVRFCMPGVRMGDRVLVRGRGGAVFCEVVGVTTDDAIAMPWGSLDGIGVGDRVETTEGAFVVNVGWGLLGRVVDGFGRPIDDGGSGDLGRETRLVETGPPAPLARRPIDRIFTTGIRAVDALHTVGEGQRIGLFAGSGVGKSTALRAIATHADADVVVVGLVGERGREVAEFFDRIGFEGWKRTVTVVATSDAAPLERLRAAQVATTYAEYFRDQGVRVLLLLDSITRAARAQREIGLMAGEAPTRRGYPPSVFTMLARLLERSGQGVRGSITAVYALLVEGGDLDEPIADETRGLLDGQIVLDRTIAASGRYPAVDFASSCSRVMPGLVDAAHHDAAARVRRWLNLLDSKRDLLAMGAYEPGGDLAFDEAVARAAEIEAFVRQDPTVPASFKVTQEALLRVAR